MTEKKTSFRLQRLSGNEANNFTRDAMGTALVKLMAEKDLGSITVTELVETAGVSRQTFYRNYSKIEDIMIEVENQLLGTMYDSFREPRYIGDRKRWFVEFYTLLYDHPDISVALCRAGFLESLRERFIPIFQEMINERHNLSYNNVIGLLGGLYFIGTQWINEGMKESPEEIAEINNDFYTRVLSGE